MIRRGSWEDDHLGGAQFIPYIEDEDTDRENAITALQGSLSIADEVTLSLGPQYLAKMALNAKCREIMKEFYAVYEIKADATLQDVVNAIVRTQSDSDVY